MKLKKESIKKKPENKQLKSTRVNLPNPHPRSCDCDILIKKSK